MLDVGCSENILNVKTRFPIQTVIELRLPSEVPISPTISLNETPGKDRLLSFMIMFFCSCDYRLQFCERNIVIRLNQHPSGWKISFTPLVVRECERSGPTEVLLSLKFAYPRDTTQTWVGWMTLTVLVLLLPERNRNKEALPVQP